MTAATIKAAEQENYSITRYLRKGKFVCWISKIGFQLNDKGERVRCWQYHGKDFAAAQRAVLELGERWGKILDEYRSEKRKAEFWIQQQISAATIDGFYLDQDENKIDYGADTEEGAKYRKKLQIEMLPALPVWRDGNPKKPELKYSDKAEPRKSVVPSVTVQAAKEIYMAAYEARVGLIGADGIKADIAPDVAGFQLPNIASAVVARIHCNPRVTSASPLQASSFQAISSSPVPNRHRF